MPTKPTTKKPAKKPAKKPVKKTSAAKKSRYIEGIGRRKAAVARVRIYPSEKKDDFLVNDLELKDYFPLERLLQTVIAPFNVAGSRFRTTVKVKGGGPSGQAGAIRLGLSRALVSLNENWRSRIKKQGFLTRDPRVVERKKPGLRKARRPQQWRKR